MQHFVRITNGARPVCVVIIRITLSECARQATLLNDSISVVHSGLNWGCLLALKEFLSTSDRMSLLPRNIRWVKRRREEFYRSLWTEWSKSHFVRYWPKLINGSLLSLDGLSQGQEVDRTSLSKGPENALLIANWLTLFIPVQYEPDFKFRPFCLMIFFVVNLGNFAWSLCCVLNAQWRPKLISTTSRSDD